MSTTLVSSVSNTATGVSTINVTMGAATSVGDLICVGINWGNTTGTYAVTDNATGGSNTYTQFPSVQTGTSLNDLNAFYAHAATAETLTITVTISGGGSHSLRVGVLIFHSTTGWVSGTGVVDVGNSAIDTNVAHTTANPGNITPAASGELLVSFIEWGSGAVSGISVTSWNEDAGGTGPGWGGLGRSDGAYLLSSGNTATTATWNWTTGQNSSSLICAFKPAAAVAFQPDEDLWDGSRSVVKGLLQATESQSSLLAIQAIPMSQPDELPQAPVAGGLGETDVDYWLLLIVQPSQDILNVYS